MARKFREVPLNDIKFMDKVLELLHSQFDDLEPVEDRRKYLYKCYVTNADCQRDLYKIYFRKNSLLGMVNVWYLIKKDEVSNMNIKFISSQDIRVFMDMILNVFDEDSEVKKKQDEERLSNIPREEEE